MTVKVTECVNLSIQVQPSVSNLEDQSRFDQKSPFGDCTRWLPCLPGASPSSSRLRFFASSPKPCSVCSDVVWPSLTLPSFHLVALLSSTRARHVAPLLLQRPLLVIATLHPLLRLFLELPCPLRIQRHTAEIEVLFQVLMI